MLIDCRNYALENAMEAANLPLVELMDRSAQHMPMPASAYSCAMQLMYQASLLNTCHTCSSAQLQIVCLAKRQRRGSRTAIAECLSVLPASMCRAAGLCDQQQQKCQQQLHAVYGMCTSSAAVLSCWSVVMQVGVGQC